MLRNSSHTHAFLPCPALQQYEYGLYSSYASDAPERKAQILPLWEEIDLQDYRVRYSTYHLDVGLRNLRYVIPFHTQ